MRCLNKRLTLVWRYTGRDNNKRDEERVVQAEAAGKKWRVALWRSLSLLTCCSRCWCCCWCSYCCSSCYCCCCCCWYFQMFLFSLCQFKMIKKRRRREEQHGPFPTSLSFLRRYEFPHLFFLFKVVWRFLNDSLEICFVVFDSLIVTPLRFFSDSSAPRNWHRVHAISG